MKTILTFFFVLTFLQPQAQKVDTVFYEPDLYVSHYCRVIKAPLYVTDTLYQTGGNCDRAGDAFVGIKGVTAVNADYLHSGYDIGHLYNAQDAASNPKKLKRTFKHYNGFPQKHHLNGGIWFRCEDTIRVLDQTQRLFVIAGGTYSGGKFIGKHVAVPDSCWKIAFDYNTDTVVRAFICPNDISGKVFKLKDNGLYNHVTQLINGEIEFEDFIKLLRKA